MTRELSLWEGYQQEMAARDREQAEALARNARLFELARHNGYATATYRQGKHHYWPIPQQLRGVAGFDVAVLS